MFILDATLNKAKDTEGYKKSRFKDYQTVQELEEYLKKELNISNVISYIKSIAKIENIINDKSLNEDINIPIENLIQKINLEENKEELLRWIKYENEKRETIKNIIDTKGIEKKLDLLIELAKVLKPISNINGKIYIKEFKEQEDIKKHNENRKKSTFLSKFPSPFTQREALYEEKALYEDECIRILKQDSKIIIESCSKYEVVTKYKKPDNKSRLDTII